MRGAVHRASGVSAEIVTHGRGRSAQPGPDQGFPAPAQVTIRGARTP
ncbi:hypothetical protein FHR78_000095 [Frigoribacterium faeni]|nr:hypothetical protein [Frigoribacterium faeni]